MKAAGAADLLKSCQEFSQTDFEDLLKIHRSVRPKRKRRKNAKSGKIAKAKGRVQNFMRKGAK